LHTSGLWFVKLLRGHFGDKHLTIRQVKYITDNTVQALRGIFNMVM